MLVQVEKVQQAKGIVKEENVDVWLTFARESSMNSDPVIPLISNVDFGGYTCVFITAKGESICLANQLDSFGMSQGGMFDEVVDYGYDFEAGFEAMLKRLQPGTMALNYSMDVAADGLTHGMYLYITGLLAKFSPDTKIVSAENIIGKLRGRKTPEEVRRLKKAADATMVILREVIDFIEVGKSQKDIHAFCQERIKAHGWGNAWEASQNPGVFIGPNPVVGHAGPGDRKVEPGDLINLDFGVMVDDYCSDVQRTYYMLKDGEEDIPEVYKEHFKKLKDAIAEGVALMKPGVEGWRPDAAAREGLIKRGYPEFKYSFGHQVGRSTHDGGVSMAKVRPGRPTTALRPLEESIVITVDANLTLDRGRIGQEDVTYIGKDGAEYISEPQEEIWLCHGKK